MNKFYLVLSIRQINQLRRAALNNRKLSTSQKNPLHCVVINLNATNVISSDGVRQLSSNSFDVSVNEIAEGR